MNRRLLILFLFISLLFIFLFILNKDTTRKISINYKVVDYKIPIYLKLSDFFDRHFEYKYLVKNINNNQSSIEGIILNTTEWINSNIKKTPIGVDVIDYHPLTIVKRRLGEQDQFNDILSVFLVYQDIDSFFIKKFKDINHSLTLFKINNYWSVIDPYNGYYFLNERRIFASIEELKTSNWEIVNLKNRKLNSFSTENYKELRAFYQKIFDNIKSTKEIENTNIFERGGRSYTQKPFSRLKYEIYKQFKKNI